MKLLRVIFGLRRIYYKQTIAQTLYLYLIAALVLFFAFGYDHTSQGFTELCIVVAVIVIYSLTRTIIKTILVDRYVRRYSTSLLMFPPAELERASINLELDKIDELRPIATFAGASLFLAVFNFYTRTKYGPFLAKQAYYSVLDITLSRTLPHILFDSKTAKKDQFKSMYLRAQRISVQGPFDDVFNTYVPETYAIDSLSFITPEVMEVLLDAKDYDLEIINNRLLLYGPLLDDQGIATFVSKGQAIAKELNDNIDTYRDDRLTGEARKNDVTFFARTLLRSPRKHLIGAVVFGAITAAIVVGSFFVDPATQQTWLGNVLSITVYALFISNAWQAYAIVRQNHKALETYRMLYETDRGKPIIQSPKIGTP